MTERIKQREDEKVCQSCEYPAQKLTEYPHRGNQYRKGVAEKDKKILLCELCASTRAGFATQFPNEMLGHETQILQTICFVGNFLADMLERQGTRG